MNNNYNITMFAYNEEDNIASSIASVFENVDARLNTFYVIANGCTDNTVSTAEKIKSKINFEKLRIIEIVEGDKCNAWNVYMHDIADDADVHFFVDADVKFTTKSFPRMYDQLMATEQQTVVVAGMPQSGRNIHFYKSLVTDRACFFGNLYGMKASFVHRIKADNFHLPKGLNWIDSFLTKAANTDLQFFDYNLPNRTTYIDDVGYYFQSLSPLRLSDIKLYFNRIARYELGKIQETFLDVTPLKDWPRDMQEINRQIENKFDLYTSQLPLHKKMLVKKRLNKLAKRK